jgi:hypothetical protein
MIARITQIQYTLNFLMNEILICYFHPQINELCHIFKGSITYLYVLIFPCILVTRYINILQTYQKYITAPITNFIKNT